MAQANVVTVAQLATELGVSTERVRQLIAEVSEAEHEEVGLVVGRTIVLTPAEVKKVRAAKAEKRKYEKSA